VLRLVVDLLDLVEKGDASRPWGEMRAARGFRLDRGETPIEGWRNFRMGRGTSAEASNAAVRVAVVGLGFGAVHVAAYRHDPRCEVVALCGRDEARVRREANRLGISKAFSDWQTLLEQKDVDVISLAVPAPAQVEIGSAALRASKHVFFEKPLADTLASAEMLARLAAENRCTTAVNFEFPEVPAWKDAKRLLDDGKIGPLRHAAISWRVETYANKLGLDGWKVRASDGGGALNLFASHCLYYLEWMFGPVRSVSASLHRPPGDAREGDTQDALVLVTEGGLPVVVAIATDAFLGCGHRLDVFGREGTLVLENRESDYVAGFRLSLAQRSDAEYRLLPTASPRSSPTEDGRVGATASILHRFIDGVLGGDTRPSPGILEGVRVQRLMDAVRAASTTGRVAIVSS
jgi:predicted dehydrogenase